MVMHSLAVKLKAIIHYTTFEPSLRRVAQVYGVSKSTVARWVKEDHMSETCQRGQHKQSRSPRKKVIDVIQSTIVDAIKCDPFCTSYDLAALVRKEHGLSVSLSTIARSRRALGFRYKLARRSQEHQRPPCNHPFLNNANVYTNAIAVDESSFVSNDTPRRGWAQGSQDVPKPAPRNRQRLTLILAITRNGVVGYQLHKGSFNAKLYAKFLETLPRHHRIIADHKQCVSMCSVPQSRKATRTTAQAAC